jgi:hypothetical protein
MPDKNRELGPTIITRGRVSTTEMGAAARPRPWARRRSLRDGSSSATSVQASFGTRTEVSGYEPARDARTGETGTRDGCRRTHILMERLRHRWKYVLAIKTSAS